MIEIYLVTSVAPIPMATMMGQEWGGMGPVSYIHLHQKHQYSKANPHGKMTVKQLAAKDKGLQSIEVTDQNIGSFLSLIHISGTPSPTMTA